MRRGTRLSKPEQGKVLAYHNVSKHIREIPVLIKRFKT